MVALSFSVSATAQQSEPNVVTEEEAVVRALNVESLVAAWDASVEAERAPALDSEAWPNPRLGYTREQSFERPDSVGEDFVVLEQTLPLSGRRGLNAEVARSRASVTESENRTEALRIATVVRTAFYRVVMLQSRVEVYGKWLETMRLVETDLKRRISAGESAPYELQRLQKEIADIVASGERDRAELAHRRAELAAITGQDPTAALRADAELMPAGVPTAEELRSRVGDHPEIVAAAQRIEAARLLERVASRWWVPEPTLSAGYRGASVGGDRFHGFIAGVDFALPVFNGARGDRARAQAEVAREEARRTLNERRMMGRMLGLASKVRQLRKTAETYRTDGVKRSEEVVKTARLAYLGGELGILELIDAYRGLVAAKLEVVSIAAEARESDIELRSYLESSLPEDEESR